MKHERILKNLAWQSVGLFEEVNQGAKTLEELKALEQMLRKLPQWKALLLSGKVEISIKLQINLNLLSQSVSEITMAIFQILTEYQLLSEMEPFIRELEKVYKSRMNVAFVKISYPLALSQKELTQMKNELAEHILKNVVWKELPDTRIIGGVQIRVDYQLYDATINHQLTTLRRLMESN
ncbi:MAG TPA: hypothetical protein ENN84_05835 [Candidatus Marinimicrobia bacterium]|nr:hypothetical protein [Candidatus Neomarinimicrobiota bacterium]